MRKLESTFYDEETDTYETIQIEVPILFNEDTTLTCRDYKEFFDYFNMLYQEYASERNENLDDHAQDLKYHLQYLIRYLLNQMEVGIEFETPSH